MSDFDSLITFLVWLPGGAASFYFYYKAAGHLSDHGKKQKGWFILFPGVLGREHFDEKGWKYFLLFWYVPPALLIGAALVLVLIKRGFAG